MTRHTAKCCVPSLTTLPCVPTALGPVSDPAEEDHTTVPPANSLAFAAHRPRWDAYECYGEMMNVTRDRTGA